MNLGGGGAPENKLLVGKKIGFTIAEVLITLGIIGIVAAMTMPMIINKAERMILAQQFKKMYANLQNTVNLVQAEWGAPYECYWMSDRVNETGYHINQCMQFWDDFLKKMKVLQTCSRTDYTCHPQYKTKEQVLADGGEVINNNCAMDFSCAQFYVLNDGTYLILKNVGVSQHNVFFIVDINGSKGPNKWGYDIYYMTLHRSNLKRSVVVDHMVCAMKEKGGMYIYEMLRE